MRVRWTSAATQDLDSIGDYISEQDGPRRARDVVVRIFERVETLSHLPNRGRVGRVKGTRELVLTQLPFLVVYRVAVNEVQVLRVIHGAQQWP
jgi:toxin ParE1/3/4